MENKQITPIEIYIELKNLENTLQRKGLISSTELSENKEDSFFGESDVPSTIEMSSFVE